MARTLGAVVAAVTLIAGVAAVTIYQRVTSFDVERVTDDVVVIRGFGGNVAVLGTERGAVVVDTMNFRLQGDQLRELAARLGGGPVQAILNTHYHRDHTHGNPGFPLGTAVVATERTRAHLLERDAGYWRGEASGNLPNQTFEGEHLLRIGGKTIRALQLGRGHTDGDLVVLFVEDRVLHAGDLLFQRTYPRIDLEGGGSVPAWIATLDRVLALDFDRVIPGHGAVTDREGLVAFQGFLREIWAVAEGAVDAGMSLEETLASARLEQDAGYTAFSVPFVFRRDRDSAIRQAFEEAQRSSRSE